VSQAIIRLYDSATQAAAAVTQLRYEGFAESSIIALSPGGTVESVVDKLLSGWVLKSNARVYAAEVHGGRWLVSVLAPFGMGGRAEEALDRYSPVASPVSAGLDRLPPWDEAAPMSSALGIPALWRGAAPNTSLGIPTTVASRWSLSAALGLPLLARSSTSKLSPGLAHWFVSAKIGLPLLTKVSARRS
jgi:hypothetical protein